MSCEWSNAMTKEHHCWSVLRAWLNSTLPFMFYPMPHRTAFSCGSLCPYPVSVLLGCQNRALSQNIWKLVWLWLEELALIIFFPEFYWVLVFQTVFLLWSWCFVLNCDFTFWPITLHSAMSHLDLVICKCKQINEHINYRQFLVSDIPFQILASIWTEGIHDDEQRTC